MRLPGIQSRAVDVPYRPGAISARVIHETPETVTVEYLVPKGLAGLTGLGELDGFFDKVWKTFRKQIIPIAAPIAGALVPQLFPEAPWYLKALPTAAGFLSTQGPIWQTPAITAGVTVASELLRPVIQPSAAPMPVTTGGSTIRVTGETAPPASSGTSAVRLPGGETVSVPTADVSKYLKIGGVVLGTVAGVFGGGTGAQAPTSAGGFSPWGAGYGMYPTELAVPGYPVESGRVLATDPYYQYGLPAGSYPQTEFLPAPGVPPETAPGGLFGTIPWGWVAIGGVVLMALAMGGGKGGSRGRSSRPRRRRRKTRYVPVAMPAPAVGR